MRRSLVLASLFLAACAIPRYEYRVVQLTPNPSMPAAQAEAICRGEAQLAGQQASSATRADIANRNAASSATTLNCTSDSYGSYGYRTTTTNCAPQTVNGAYAGRYGTAAAVADGLAPGAAYEQAKQAAGNACFARYGWGVEKHCVANCR